MLFFLLVIVTGIISVGGVLVVPSSIPSNEQVLLEIVLCGCICHIGNVGMYIFFA